MYRLRILLIVLTSLVGATAACAQQPDAPSSYFQLSPQHQVFIDTHNNIPVSEVLKQSSQWSAVSGASVNLGFNEYPVWLRFDVDVQTGSPLEALVELGSPFLDYADLYLVEWQLGQPVILDHQLNGDHREYDSRYQQHRYPLYRVNYPHSGKYSLFFRVETESPIMFEVLFHYSDQYYQSEIHSQVFYGIYFGMLFVLGYFNLVLLIYLRERTFLHNLFFVISMGVYEAALSGFGYAYLWAGNAAFNDHALVVSAALSFFFGGRFAIQFLELKLRAPMLYKTAHVLLSGFLVPVLLVTVVSEFINIMILQVLSLLTALYAFAVIIHQVHARNPSARYLLLGWSITIGGYCVFVFSMFGWLQYGGAVLYLQAIGLGLGNVLVTTAIAARVQKERREKTSALHQALELSQDVARLTREKEHLESTANQHLQQEVEEKTQELNQMLEYLQSSNRRLERDSVSDALTGLHNRRYLDSVFADNVAQCIRHRSSIGVLVIDADHFKKINDNFGHLAGDEVLRKLATILQKYCRRNLDILVRYGGEEFVMLLPATDLEGVLKIAESIRHHVQYAQFWFDDKRVPVTVSMGVHVGIPPMHATPEKLMHKADEALYQAKTNGRNRVEVYKSPFEVVKA